MDLHLTGKLATVTGAARGIGAAIADSLVREGARVLAVDRDPGVEALSANPAVEALVCDLSDIEAGAAIARCTAELGGCSILVNNAGISAPAAIDQITDESWADVMAVNLDAAFRLTRDLWPQLVENRGCVVNIASFASKRATLFGNNASYTVSKHGIAGLTRATAMDGASKGVRVNAVAPGVVNTDLVRLHDEATRARIQGMIPLGRYADPADIADAVTFLASARAAHITGEIVSVNGGLVMD